MTKEPTPSQQRRAIWLLLGVGLFIVTMFAAINNRMITGLEQEIFLVVYELPLILHWPFLIVTQFGSAWMLYGLTAGLAFTHRYRLALRVFLAGAAAYVLTEIFKHLIARPRPSGIIAGVSAGETSLTSYGFPSGHVALATAISLSLLPFLPKAWRWLPMVWIGTVAISRLYLGVHAPLDVIGGFAVGLITAMSQQYFSRILPSIKTR